VQVGLSAAKPNNLKRLDLQNNVGLRFANSTYWGFLKNKKDVFVLFYQYTGAGRRTHKVGGGERAGVD